MWDRAITRKLISQTGAWPSQRPNGSCLSPLAALLLCPEHIFLLDLLPVLLEMLLGAQRGNTERHLHRVLPFCIPPAIPKTQPLLSTQPKGAVLRAGGEPGFVMEARGEH